MNPLLEELPGDSEPIKRLRSEIERAARTDLPVLITGETGSGKTVAARLIHDLSSRKGRPFVAVNISAIPSSLASAELVGHAKGAFTGAVSARQGLFERANGGTIFLDEIANAPSDVQSILLSILGSGSVRPLGEATSHNVDVRMIAATNQDMSALIEGGRFYADLYHRLAAITIRIPPLRERKSDIPALAAKFLEKISTDAGKALVLAPDAVRALQRYGFPGNFRELQNILQLAAVTAPGTIIDLKTLHLPRGPGGKRPSRAKPRVKAAASQQIDVLQRELDALRATSIVAQPIWQGRRFQTQHDYCFVLMPFGEVRDLQTLYRDHVKAVVERLGLRCERADDIYDVSGVMQSVWEGINRARLVVADLTERNANVFYELGIAHTLGKPVIMLSQSIDFVPFDLRHLRCIVYAYTPRGAAQLEHKLERTIKTVLSSAADLGSGNDQS